MYKAIQNKKYYLALHRFPKTAKNPPYNYAYTTGFRTWTSDDMISYSLVIGTFRIIFGIKKENLCTNDINTKLYKLMCINYVYNKKTRKLINNPVWKHNTSYKTLQGINDALQYYRKHHSKDIYPADEKKYPNLLPTITITKYKILEY